MLRAYALPILAATLLVAAPALAQTVATGAGREDELDQAARIDAYLADSPAPSSASRTRMTAAETAASAGALPRSGPLPPMAPDSPWARGTVGPIDGPLSLAAADGSPAPCDHAVHGEVGAEIGTQGERGGYGVASMPVGRDCQTRITVSAGTQRGPRWRGRDGEVNGGAIQVDSPGFSLGLSGVTSTGRGPAF